MAAEVGVDAGGKHTLRPPSALRPERFPIEGVVPRLRGVVEQRRHTRIACGTPRGLLRDRFERAVREIGVPDECVGLIDVGAMVLAVVNRQRRAGNQRLERLVGIRKSWQFDRHWRFLFRFSTTPSYSASAIIK